MVGYIFSVKYKPGNDNVAAHSLLRQHEDVYQLHLVSCNAISQLVPSWLEEIKKNILEWNQNVLNKIADAR